MKKSTVFWMVVAALAVRIAFMVAFDTYHFVGVDDMTKVGETTNIAASIARGHGFSSPFGGEYTGPTAWIAPVYPYFIALVFHFFGIFSNASAAVVFTIQALFSALTVIPILGIANKTVGKRSGLVAAWTWTLFPWFSKWALTWEWEVSLSALLLSLIVWYMLSLEKAAAVKSWAGFGILEGFAQLVNPALSAVLPVAFAWQVYKLRFNRKE
jgi:4-amino-4-deoxy-L-arabinose transferase-like glycosyltransferase